MEKQGFSIIELMVTVVIMGVLAAVAVPKLFGFMAKAKASELLGAGGTYIKLQDAYSHAHSIGGSWSTIGYRSPAGNSSGKASTANFEYDAEQTAHNWTAKSTVSLNHCSHGQTWYINYELGHAPIGMNYWASADDVSNCIDELVPSFKKLSSSTKAITTPGQ